MVDTSDPAFGLLDRLQHQGTHSRRLRPTDLDISTSDEHRIPLRAEKLNRRESRLGLRNLFGRQKTGNDEELSATRELNTRSGGIRASLAEFSNWPYGLQGHKSEIALPFLGQSSQLRPKTPPGSEHFQHKKSASAAKAQPSPKSTQRATWDPPPLFQAYPQAIRHVQLPACTLPAETIIRLYGPKGGNSLRDGFATSGPEDPAGDKGEKTKKRHRRNTSASSFKADWTTKIYVLVTSGYLLQYAGEGSFDRLPEKMLHLGKDSAAFASDVIPGRHWVLQVSSVMDPDGLPAAHSTSLFSRLPFRGVEKKQTSNFLMVFESAEEMEAWIVVLRREIEALGGKKSLSETGKPKIDDNILHLRAQPSQRTLVMRDPDRFSKVLTQEMSWEHPETQMDQGLRLSSAESDVAHDRSFDDTSTASGISQDGRQLDGLRDSTHRLSYVSSGQRTVVTSAGSSPACSPVRDSFGSQVGEAPLRDVPHEGQAWPRPRPNASAISDRRQSMQATNHLAEMRAASTAPRPLSTTYSSSSHPPRSASFSSYSTPPPPTIPNFSVPHAVSKRYSLAMQPPPLPEPTLSSSMSTQQSLGVSRPSRRPPPTAISINPRPLSLVVDQPSPQPSSPDMESKLFRPPEDATTAVTDMQAMFSSWRSFKQDQGQTYSTRDGPRTGLGNHDLGGTDDAPEVLMHPGARKQTSISTIRASGIATEMQMDGTTTGLPIPVPLASERPTSSSGLPRKYLRSMSSMDTYGRSRSPPPSWQGHYKRFSLRPASPDGVEVGPSEDADITVTITSITSQDSSIRAHTPTLFKATSSKAQTPSTVRHLGVGSKSLFSRRSMSRLTDIPPPAPPPTCALPPLPPPRKAS